MTKRDWALLAVGIIVIVIIIIAIIAVRSCSQQQAETDAPTRAPAPPPPKADVTATTHLRPQRVIATCDFARVGFNKRCPMGRGFHKASWNQ